MAQLHKRFSDAEIKSLLKGYVSKEVSGKHIRQMLDIRERRFFKLVKDYKSNPDKFSIQAASPLKSSSLTFSVSLSIIRISYPAQGGGI